jgi:Zn-finger nucleic acid-binding protein
MKCPLDESDLVMTERQGIEIDYCPKCRGVWLDRGELDKLIERSATIAPPQDRPSGHYREPSYDYPRPRKRKSLLGEIFDF